MTDARARLVVVGGGRMGVALVKVWATNYSALQSNEVLVVDPDRGARDRIEAFGCRTTSRAEKAAFANVDTVVLAVKPQVLEELAEELAAVLPAGVLLISIIAGVRLDKLKALFPRAFIVRAMPNTPTELGHGATAFIGHEAVTDGQRERTQALLEAGGVVVELTDEAQMDAVTGLSGSGPAYVFALVEAMAQAGVAQGLPEPIANTLARATVAGAGAMLAEDGADPAALREAVTSPGGTTQAALDVLRGADGLPSLMKKTVAAAARRAGELGG